MLAKFVFLSYKKFMVEKQYNEVKLFLDKEGDFFLNGQIVENKRVKKLFHSLLKQEEDGKFTITITYERATVTAEDVYAFAEKITGVTEDGRLIIRCLCGNEFFVHPSTLTYRGGTSDFVGTRDGDGLLVRFLRNAHNDLAVFLSETPAGGIAVNVGGESFKVKQIRQITKKLA